MHTDFPHPALKISFEAAATIQWSANDTEAGFEPEAELVDRAQNDRWINMSKARNNSQRASVYSNAVSQSPNYIERQLEYTGNCPPSQLGTLRGKSLP